MGPPEPRRDLVYTKLKTGWTWVVRSGPASPCRTPTAWSTPANSAAGLVSPWRPGAGPATKSRSTARTGCTGSLSCGTARAGWSSGCSRTTRASPRFPRAAAATAGPAVTTGAGCWNVRVVWAAAASRSTTAWGSAPTCTATTAGATAPAWSTSRRSHIMAPRARPWTATVPATTVYATWWTRPAAPRRPTSATARASAAPTWAARCGALGTTTTTTWCGPPTSASTAASRTCVAWRPSA